MDTEYIDGIPCKRVETGIERRTPSKMRRYGSVPLDWLRGLSGDSGKVKIVTILWFLSAVTKGEWFSISAQLRKEYGLSQSQTTKILASFEKSGHVKLRRSPGKSTKIQLVKPKGWN